MTIQDFHDLVRLLEAHPQWRAELRQLLLSDELLALPDLVRELAAAQRRTEERVEQLATVMQQLVARVGQLTDDVGTLKGYVLERKYRERAPAYFEGLLRGIHALSAEEVARLVDEAVSRGGLSTEDRRAILETDLVIRGVRLGESTETYLAVEISVGIGRHDVTRAQQRARILQRLVAKPVLPVVAGEWITSDAEEQATATDVWRVLNGGAMAPGADGTTE